jgi:hypothetical protein
MRLVLNIRFSLLSGLLLPLVALGAELSPYSPAFFLNPYQVEWDSSISYTQSNYTIVSPILNNSSSSVSSNVTQGLSIGLPDNYAVGISDVYVHPIMDNPLNPYVPTGGFKNPVISANKLWDFNSKTQLKLNASVQPNTGVKAGLTTYNFGATGIYSGTDDWVASFGVNETVNDGSDGGTATAIALLSKKLGAYLINASAGASRFPSSLMLTGYAATSYGYAGTLEISRAILDNAWLGINYSIGSTSNTYTQYLYSYSIPANNRLLYNSVGASLKVLF